MVNHLSAPSEHRVLVIPLASDNSRSLTPVRVLHAHVSQTKKIDKFVNSVGQFVGTKHSRFTNEWKLESYEVMPSENDRYSGVVLVYYKQHPKAIQVASAIKQWVVKRFNATLT